MVGWSVTDGFHRNASCDANTTTSVLSQLCIGKNNCSIEASSAAFGYPAGQPCYGTLKSLAAQIQCTGDPPPPPPGPPGSNYKRCGLVAEFDDLTLGCPLGKPIDSVVMASFGTPCVNPPTIALFLSPLSRCTSSCTLMDTVRESTHHRTVPFASFSSHVLLYSHGHRA